MNPLLTPTARLKVALLVCSGLYAVPVAAQDLPEQQAPPASAPASGVPQEEPAPDDEDVAEIVVTGTRRSLEDALATKRNSVEVLDSISSEGIGRLPDLNLAESLQRLPGVQINRSAQRRAGTVSIRGLPGDFSQTLINGQYLASPDVSNFAFGNVRSEVFSGIDVQKATNASSLTGGLSGLVNLKTGDPLSSSQQLTLTVDGRYEELTEEFSPGAAFVFSKELIPDVLGVRAAVGYRKLNYREDSVQINTYDRVAGGTTVDLTDDVFAPRQVRLPTQLTMGDAISASGAVEWKPTETVTASVKGLYNDFDPDFYQSQFLFETTATSTRTAIETSDDGAFGRTQNRIRTSNAQIITDSRFDEARQRTGAITGNVRWEHEGWRVDGVAHYTKAKRELFSFGSTVNQRAATGGASNGIVIEFDTGAGRLGNVFYDLQSGTARPNLNQPFTLVNASPFREARANGNPLLSYIGGFRNSTEQEDELAFQLDVVRDLDFGPLKSVAVGGVHRDKSQAQRFPLQSLFGVDLSQINNDFYNYSFLDGSGAFLDGRVGQFDRADYGELDAERVRRILRPTNPTGLPSNAAIGPGGIVEITDTTAIANAYDNKQKIYGGYLQLNLDQRITDDIQIRGNVGVRYEKSERATTSRNAANQPVLIDFSFDNWLPSANLVVETANNFVFRAAYSRTLRRPQVDSFAVLRSVAVDGVGGLITVNLGAGDLRPFTSDNYDFAVEWYNRAGSSFAATLFKKDVKDFAGSTRSCPVDGGGFGFGPLSNASGVCRTTQATPAGNGFPAVISGATTLINVTANQDSFTLKGFELSAQQNLSFLPAPWNGFGGQVNYTYVDFSSSSTFRLSEISKNTINILAYYETPDFGIRAAYNFRSKYFLASAGTFSGADRFVMARPQLDLTASVNVTDRLSAIAELFNVTNEILYEYEGAESRARNYTVYGRTVSAGFTYRF